MEMEPSITEVKNFSTYFVNGVVSKFLNRPQPPGTGQNSDSKSSDARQKRPQEDHVVDVLQELMVGIPGLFSQLSPKQTTRQHAENVAEILFAVSHGPQRQKKAKTQREAFGPDFESKIPAKDRFAWAMQDPSLIKDRLYDIIMFALDEKLTKANAPTRVEITSLIAGCGVKISLKSYPSLDKIRSQLVWNAFQRTSASAMHISNILINITATIEEGDTMCTDIGNSACRTVCFSYACLSTAEDPGHEMSQASVTCEKAVSVYRELVRAGVVKKATSDTYAMIRCMCAEEIPFDWNAAGRLALCLPEFAAILPDSEPETAEVLGTAMARIENFMKKYGWCAATHGGANAVAVHSVQGWYAKRLASKNREKEKEKKQTTKKTTAAPAPPASSAVVLPLFKQLLQRIDSNGSATGDEKKALLSQIRSATIPSVPEDYQRSQEAIESLFVSFLDHNTQFIASVEDAAHHSNLMKSREAFDSSEWETEEKNLRECNAVSSVLSSSFSLFLDTFWTIESSAKSVETLCSRVLDWHLTSCRNITMLFHLLKMIIHLRQKLEAESLLSFEDSVVLIKNATKRLLEPELKLPPMSFKNRGHSTNFLKEVTLTERVFAVCAFLRLYLCGSDAVPTSFLKEGVPKIITSMQTAISSPLSKSNPKVGKIAAAFSRWWAGRKKDLIRASQDHIVTLTETPKQGELASSPINEELVEVVAPTTGLADAVTSEEEKPDKHHLCKVAEVHEEIPEDAESPLPTPPCDLPSALIQIRMLQQHLKAERQYSKACEHLLTQAGLRFPSHPTGLAENESEESSNVKSEEIDDDSVAPCWTGSHSEALSALLMATAANSVPWPGMP